MCWVTDENLQLKRIQTRQIGPLDWPSQRLEIKKFDYMYERRPRDCWSSNGTTRDTVIPFYRYGWTEFVDTAGMRKSGKESEPPEKILCHALPMRAVDVVLMNPDLPKRYSATSVSQV